MNDEQRPATRVRVEQGIYQQPNGKYAVCFMVDGRGALSHRRPRLRGGPRRADRLSGRPRVSPPRGRTWKDDQLRLAPNRARTSPVL